jgi:hypothetical protein
MHFKGLSGSMTPKGYLFRRARSPGKAKFNVEFADGESFHRKAGRWNLVTQIVDRIRGWYYKHVVDPETGAVLRHVEEPLGEHRSRVSSTKGSADPPKP